MTDCNSLTGWSETEDGNVGEVTVLHGDWFDINITSSGGNKIYYWSNDANIGKLSNEYTKIFWRYKTSSTSIKAKIVLEFADTDTQTVLNEESNTTWKSGSATINEDETIDHIRLHANQATGHVYYDFALICKGTFTFPGVSGRAGFNPSNRFADIEIPGRVTDITQNLGAPSSTVTVTGDMDLGDWGTPKGDKLLDVLHSACTEAFQWFTCDEPKVHFKVTLRDADLFYEGGSDGKPGYSVELKEYSLSSKSNETYAERFGL